MAPALLFAALVALAAFIPAPASAQHTCVYCVGSLSPPDTETFRLACKVNNPENLECPITGAMPECSEFEDASPPDSTPAVCSPDPSALGCGRRCFSCPSYIRAYNQTWDIRAVIMIPSCPVESTIWFECAGDTPICQWTGTGVRGVGPNNVAVGTALPPGVEAPTAEAFAVPISADYGDYGDTPEINLP